MKFITYSKRVLSFLLVFAMLFLVCACTSNSNETEANNDSQSSETDKPAETEKPLLETDILLSGEKPVRIIYADGYRSMAVKVQDKIIGLDKNYTNGNT